MIAWLNILIGWDLAKKMQSKRKVYVKHFSGIKIACMINNSKPLWDGPNHFFLHVGTNDSKLEKTQVCTVQSITDLTVSLKNKKHEVSPV